MLDAWNPFDVPGRREPVEEQPGTSRAVPVIELLDDDVDLAPARHLPPPATGGGAAELVRVRERLDDTLKLTARLTPPPAAAGEPARRPFTTVGELARTGALHLRTGSGSGSGSGTVPVLTEHDVIAGTAPSGTPSTQAAPPTTNRSCWNPATSSSRWSEAVRSPESSTRPPPGRRSAATSSCCAPIPRPWTPGSSPVSCGAPRTTGRPAAMPRPRHGSTPMRLRVPRLPLDEQRKYGEQFSALAAFEEALRVAGRLGGQLVQGMYDGLTDGSVAPE